MTIFDPPHAGSPTWQLPWLRLSLILRQMTTNEDCGEEDLAELLTVRRILSQQGWFN